MGYRYKVMSDPKILTELGDLKAQVAGLMATSEQRELNRIAVDTRLLTLEERVRTAEQATVNIGDMKTAIEALSARVQSIEKKIYIAVGALTILMPIINQLVGLAAKSLG